MTSSDGGSSVLAPRVEFARSLLAREAWDRSDRQLDATHRSRSPFPDVSSSPRSRRRRGSAGRVLLQRPDFGSTPSRKSTSLTRAAIAAQPASRKCTESL